MVDADRSRLLSDKQRVQQIVSEFTSLIRDEDFVGAMEIVHQIGNFDEMGFAAILRVEEELHLAPDY